MFGNVRSGKGLAWLVASFLQLKNDHWTHMNVTSILYDLYECINVCMFGLEQKLVWLHFHPLPVSSLIKGIDLFFFENGSKHKKRKMLHLLYHIADNLLRSFSMYIQAGRSVTILFAGDIPNVVLCVCKTTYHTLCTVIFTKTTWLNKNEETSKLYMYRSVYCYTFKCSFCFSAMLMIIIN